MTTHRVVCISHPSPVSSAREILNVCHNFPERKAQSGIRGKLLSYSGQFLLFLEGEQIAVERLVARIQREVPEAGMTVHLREAAEAPAFRGWSIDDIYLDEIRDADVEAAETIGDLVIDLMAGVTRAVPAAAETGSNDEQETEDAADADETLEVEEVDVFAEAASLLDRFETPLGRVETVASEAA